MTKKEFVKRIAKAKGHIKRNSRPGVCVALAFSGLDADLFYEMFFPLFDGQLSLSMDSRRPAYWLDIVDDDTFDYKNLEGRLLMLDTFEEIVIKNKLYELI